MRYFAILCLLLAWALPIRIQARQSIVFDTAQRPRIIPTDLKIQTVEPVVAKPTKPAVKKTTKYNKNYCSCVNYVKAKIGYTKTVGAARNFPINSKTPSKGAVIVTYESRIGHVALVDSFDDKYIYLESEANYSRCKLTMGRKIPINSTLIKGFYVSKI